MNPHTSDRASWLSGQPHSPVTIPFPDPAEAEVRRQERAAIAREQERVITEDRLRQAGELHAAHAEGRRLGALHGHELGHRSGWVSGVKWGTLCGVVLGATLVAAALQIGRHWGAL